jgi:poly(A) polymerase
MTSRTHTDSSVSADAERLPQATLDAPDIELPRLDSDAVRVLAKLKHKGFEAYLVGGCVRDLLLGRMPKDYDIATSATPNQVRSLFRNSRLIGRRFRLAHVFFKEGKILEVATFRAMPNLEDPTPAPESPVEEAKEKIASQAEFEAPESEISEGETTRSEIEPEASAEVAPAAEAKNDLYIAEDNTFGTAQEDALRRDFTMNGLFYDPMSGRVIDYVSGLRDVAANEIRTIGDPFVRMREDPVRILRAARFASKLQFEIESLTWAAMEDAVEDLPRCSAPRLLEETFRLLRAGTALKALKLVEALGALGLLLTPVDDYLRRQDEAGKAEYWAFVGAMDALVLSGVVFDDSMLLACILLPLALEEPDTALAEQGGRPSVAQAVEALLNSLVQKARLPRRMAERTRMLLMSQRTLAGQRRRRGGLNGFRGHPLFNESLSVFEVWSMATGEFAEALAKWKSGSAPMPAPDADGPKRKRRRRRGAKPDAPVEE